MDGQYIWKNDVLEYIKGNADHDEVIFLTDGGNVVGGSGKTTFTRELEVHPTLNAVTSSACWGITSALMLGHHHVSRRVDNNLLSTCVNVEYPIDVICFDPPRAEPITADVLRHILHWKLMHKSAHVLVFLPKGVSDLSGNEDFAEVAKIRIWYLTKHRLNSTLSL